jgi:hypothetical protein
VLDLSGSVALFAEGTQANSLTEEVAIRGFFSIAAGASFIECHAPPFPLIHGYRWQHLDTLQNLK